MVISLTDIGVYRKIFKCGKREKGKLCTIMNNKLLNISLISWLTAQIIKVIICFIQCKKWDYKKIFESGGMPSAHTAFVCALAYSIAWKYGISSDYFAIVFSFSLIVMYDAMGVRNESGKHAKIINAMQNEMQISNKTQLKESLGHQPLEVIFGVVLGVGISAVARLF